MHFFMIIITTVVLNRLSSNALDPVTVCDTDAACECNKTDVSCLKLLRDPPFVLPNDTTTVRFVDVPIKILDQNATSNGRKLQRITWVASSIMSVEILYHDYLEYLDLSRNSISKLSNNTFDNCPRLKYMDLSNNKISFLSDNLFSPIKMLETVKLENNMFYSISDNLLKETTNLKNLSIGNPNLAKIAANAMINLDKLEYLSIENSGIENLNRSSFGRHEYLKTILLNNCPNLKSIDDDLFSSAPNTEVIELNNCTIMFLPSSIVSIENLKHLKMFETKVQPNCHNGWFSQWFNETTVIGYEGYTHLIETINKLDCPPKIYHTSGSITLQLTKKGVINCVVYGNPPPAITWLVPGGITFHENKEADTHISYHPNVHNWDLNQIVSQTLLTDKNGSLRILRMLRTNIGNYTCYASNKYGNDSKMVEVHLDSGVFFNIKINALLLGIASALGFLVLTILCCALKLLLVRLNCIKKRNQPAETEMGTTEKTKSLPEDV